MTTPVYGFEVYIKWGTNPYGYPVHYKATSHADAAQQRVSDLGQPSKYDGVIVVGRGAARIFDIVPVPRPYELVER